MRESIHKITNRKSKNVIKSNIKNAIKLNKNMNNSKSLKMMY